jgi:hypothetical protein
MGPNRSLSSAATGIFCEIEVFKPRFAVYARLT